MFVRACWCREWNARGGGLERRSIFAIGREGIEGRNQRGFLSSSYHLSGAGSVFYFRARTSYNIRSRIRIISCAELP